jgi:aarF domain-containing kinase
LNILRANNKEMGSPVNRINVMALAAVRGDESIQFNHRAENFSAKAHRTWRLVVFRFRLWTLSTSFHVVQWWSKLRNVWDGSGRSFEQVQYD